MVISKKKKNPRRSGVRKYFPVILIVTEGLKTEPSYFRKLREEYGLSKSRVWIVASKRPAPTQLVKEAQMYIENENIDYHSVFCVFDRDDGEKYDQAISELGKLQRRADIRCKNFVVVPSIPCFEFWYLLHVSASRKPYGLMGAPCNSLITDLRKFPLFAKYDKSDCDGFYDNIAEFRKIAVERSKRILYQARKDKGLEYYEDPSSRVFLVVEFLEKLEESYRKELHNDQSTKGTVILQTIS